MFEALRQLWGHYKLIRKTGTPPHRALVQAWHDRRAIKEVQRFTDAIQPDDTYVYPSTRRRPAPGPTRPVYERANWPAADQHVTPDGNIVLLYAANDPGPIADQPCDTGTVDSGSTDMGGTSTDTGSADCSPAD